MRLRIVALAASGLVAVVVLAACGSNGDMANMPGMSGNSTSSAPTSPPPASSTADATSFNASDAMFATMMIPHHEQAIEMADLILGKDNIDQRVVTLAQQIKDAQRPEIQTMKGWLQDWGTPYQEPTASSGGMGDMNGMSSMSATSSTGGTGGMGGMDGGMMSQQDMDALRTATGADAAKLFLTGMIAHHKGAVDMARSELTDGQNPDAKALAQKIIDGQTAEISTMQKLLDQE
jgi:uncharacterized protein (DUF305 family)